MPNSSRKNVPLAQPPAQPRLIVPRLQAQQKLEAHIAKGRELTQREIHSQDAMDQVRGEGDKWRDYTIRLLGTLFDTPTLAAEYGQRTQLVSISMGRDHFAEAWRNFKTRMNTWWIKELESITESLELMPESPLLASETQSKSIPVPQDPRAATLAKIELIVNRFHSAAKQLRYRHADRDTLTIRDEYDVQDFFHVLLRLFFEDIRDEEWTPSYAGGASRIDFLLKQEQILVEIKMTRTGLAKGKDVSDQLIIDSERYRIHPDCKMLVAFVYDPQEFLNNSTGIEHDLTKTINDVPVKVFIRQR